MTQSTTVTKEINLMFGTSCVLHFIGDERKLYQVDFKQLVGNREESEEKIVTWYMPHPKDDDYKIVNWLKKIAEEAEY